MEDPHGRVPAFVRVGKLIREFRVDGADAGLRLLQIDARIQAWPVDAVVEAQDLREQDDAVEIDAAKVGG